MFSSVHVDLQAFVARQPVYDTDTGVMLKSKSWSLEDDSTVVGTLHLDI